MESFKNRIPFEDKEIDNEFYFGEEQRQDNNNPHQCILWQCSDTSKTQNSAHQERKENNLFRMEKFCKVSIIQAFQTVTFFCNITCLMLAIVHTEGKQLINGQQQTWMMSDLMLISSVVSSLFHTMAYANDLKVQFLSDDEQSKMVRPLDIIYGIFKSIYLLIAHPTEYFSKFQVFHTHERIFQNANSILATMCYFRIIFIYTYLSKNSRYYGTRISRLLSVYGHRSRATNIMYTIKCLFKQQGMISNLFLLLFSTVFLAFLGISFSKESSLLTYIYYCLETMTTIGFGQFKSQNNLQRFVLVIVVILGSFASSVFTIYLLQFLELGDKQLKAYRLIKRLQFQDKISILKLEIIQKFLRKKTYLKNKKNVWRQFQKELQYDKSPMLQFLTVKYTYFCNNLRILLQRHLLSNNLLTFYFNRRMNYEKIKEENQKQQLNAFQPNMLNKRRVEDSYKIYAIKQKILGYQK